MQVDRTTTKGIPAASSPWNNSGIGILLIGLNPWHTIPHQQPGSELNQCGRDAAAGGEQEAELLRAVEDGCDKGGAQDVNRRPMLTPARRANLTPGLGR